MSKYLGSVVLLLVGVACGGTTDSNDPTGSGSSAGGTDGGDKNGGGAAGKTSGGSIGVGGYGGAGGSVILAGSGGVGGQSVDPRCPERRPMGACMAAGLTCEYDQFTGCLCYPGSYGLCNAVDPYCPNGSNAGGAPPAPPAQAGAGSGGFSIKIVAPAQHVCSCQSGSWVCNFGFAR